MHTKSGLIKRLSSLVGLDTFTLDAITCRYNVNLVRRLRVSA